MGKDNPSGEITAEKVLPGVPFVKGDPRINLKGRPPGSGISLTTEVKKKLSECPEGSKATYLELLINRIFKQAIQDGDQQMIKQIWNYIDGMPKGEGTNIQVNVIPILGGRSNAIQGDDSDEEAIEAK